jgi:predicted house-cleaning noncanonical NTP pyrophosphatase (MazG superfamily)
MMGYEQLKEFLEERMTMTDVYQPVIIRDLILHDGQRTKNQLAITLISYDEYTLNKFRRTVMRWPKITLTKHDLIKYERRDKLFSLNSEKLSEDEKDDLVKICESKIEKFLARTKKDSGKHFGWGLKRYNALKQSRGKCELCGIPKELRNLDADHIVPKSKANKHDKVIIDGELVDVDSEKNIQILCSKCNRSKGNLDDADFRKRNKLVRDKIPEIIRQHGREPKISVLTDDKLLNALNEKLVEEHGEYIESGELEELGDMLEVIFSLAKEKGYTEGELLHLLKDKRNKKGGFDEGFYYSGDQDN